MVCSSHLKVKYVRCLIKYHLLIFVCTLVLTSCCLSFFIFKRDQLHADDLLRGFLAHGTTSSDDYRKLIALLRQTQTTQLYPHRSDNQIYQQTPYPTFRPHMNPCSKRFHLAECPILSYTELIFEFQHNRSGLFDDLHTMKGICKLEWDLRAFYTNCSSDAPCCHLIGPVSLLSRGQMNSSDQCDDLTTEDLHEYHQQWVSCRSSSSCSNSNLYHYLNTFQSVGKFKIYLSIENHPQKLVHLYESLQKYRYEHRFAFKEMQINGKNEEILFHYFLEKNLHIILLTIALYFLCLIFFVKNLFFILAILVHLVLTCGFSLLIYSYIFHLPWTMLNLTSLILYFFIVLIDSFLWYACWFINNHRRDDCPIQRIVENLVTQAFFYLMPKNLTAIIALVITYTNQIIALQCFTVFSFLLITISFVISFALYPASFVFILRYQSSIPTIEHFSHRLLATTTSCFIDRTIPYLIVRLKAVWLTLLTLVFCFAFAILFHWPKLQFDVCRITFDTLPGRSSCDIDALAKKTFDIDVSYYIGSKWEVPDDSWLIPRRDIPQLVYNEENKMTSIPGDLKTFDYALRTNLSQLIQFCASFKHPIEKRQVKYKQYHRHVLPQMIPSQNSSPSLPTLSALQGDTLTVNDFPCFGDLSLVLPDASSSSSSPPAHVGTKLSAIIRSYQNQTDNCQAICSFNDTDSDLKCIPCLIKLFYRVHPDNDLFFIKNGLRYINDQHNPRYLLQTVNYRWQLKTDLNDLSEWKRLFRELNNNFIARFYMDKFTHMSFWSTHEWFATFAIMERLQLEKHYIMAAKFLVILIFLTLFTGVLGIFVTLTTLFNFVTCMATLTLLNYKLTVENMSYFVIVLVICSQYSVLYSISYKLAPTFFFQRENRTMYSLKQLCTTLINVTFAIVLISTPCLFSSLPYLSKSAMVYIISSLISLIYSTFFLQPLLCLIGPAGHSCCFIPWRLTFTRHLTLHVNNHVNHEVSFRSTSSGGGARRHHRHLSHPRMSTSSYFASSYFSQIFTGSTYFESDYSGLNDPLSMASRRRESSRSHQLSHAIKRNSLLTGELIELYTPRASLAPHAHSHRYSRQSSVGRGVPTATLARPLYVSPSISPFSQLSIHSQAVSRQRSPSPHVFRPSRSPSPRSFAPPSSPPVLIHPSAPLSCTSSLRPCYSAPRLHAPLHRMQTTMAITGMRPNEILFEETSTVETVRPNKKTVMIIQRQDAISTPDDLECASNTSRTPLSAATKRSMLKDTTIESGGSVWLKRSNSS